ncbi:unnamed protein product [Spirodela intermedia]|uniref:YTH domain-containing family protein n=1 Tax=Spirodela intermedia TaxID=51605 RepID=A0A7I8JBP1_SPIIN|nr:unnamed protein product [Spirodela intermedia]CAA6667155.1 unnamed protein product [Spirodela intermedia]
MAAVAPVADQATDLLQKLSLDSQTKTNGASEVTKKPAKQAYGSADGGDRTSAPVPSSERSMTPLLQEFMDPSMCYLPNGYASPAYYYGAYDGSVTDWEEYSRYLNPDEMPPSGVYGDVYHHGYGYAPYGAYAPPGSPVPTIGHDGQLYGPQHYQYPGPYYPPATPTNSTFTPNNPPPSSQAEVSAPVSSDQTTVSVDATKSNSNGISNGNSNGNNWTLPLKPSPQNSSTTSNGSYGRGPIQGSLPSGYPDSRYSYDGVRSPVPWLDCPTFLDGQHRVPTTSSVSSPVFHAGNNSSTRNHNLRPFPHMMGLHSPRPNSGMGPGGTGLMNNLYPNARIEDDVHKSIKYNVWASTASGNKKLDAAYQESKAKDSASLFSFFSLNFIFQVNTSGQFVGIAEMVGPVDFNKTVEYWQQDKWTGCFPVKWHIVKDVPNRILKHITLENNENKPVTNSRDTQEVKLDQGLQMLKLFKEHVSKTSILDDFLFYESARRPCRREGPSSNSFRNRQCSKLAISARRLPDDIFLTSSVWDGKAAGTTVVDEVDGVANANGKLRLQKPLDSPVMSKEATQVALGELKPVERTGSPPADREKSGCGCQRLLAYFDDELGLGWGCGNGGWGLV